MQSQYSAENSYSFVVDASQNISNAHYEVDTPETAFERDIQNQLAEANRLLVEGKYSTALNKYLHLRGIIANVLDSRLSVNGSSLNWPQLNLAGLVDTLIGRAGEMLKNTPILVDKIPEKLGTGGIKLPDNMVAQINRLGEIGLKDREVQLGVLLNEAAVHIENKDFAKAANAFQTAARETANTKLQAAFLHDLAVMQERSGNRGQALTTLKRSASLYEQAKDFELQVTVLSTLAGMQGREGTLEAAQDTLKQAEGLQIKHNLVPLSSGGLIKDTLAAQNYQLIREPQIEPLQSKVPVIGKLSTSISTSVKSGMSPVTATTAPELLEDLMQQPLQLISAHAFATRETQKQLTVRDGKGNLVNIVLDNNATQNMIAFYEKLKTTEDPALLMGYLENYTTTVAYLPHIFYWIIPMAIGDCQAALGSYEEAEAEYLSTLDYKYLNQTVEIVNLWLRLAGLYLEWGDRLYRQALNDVSRFGAAKEKYEYLLRSDNTIDLSSPLYKNQKFASMRSRINNIIQGHLVQDAPPQENLCLIIAIIWAAMQISKIDNDINYFGLGVHIPPFSFEHLQNVARYFTQHAAQVEQMYIQFQSTGENERLREQQMAQQADIARASAELERRGLDEALEGLDVARAGVSYAGVQRENAVQAKQDFADARWELLELDGLQAWSSASAVAGKDQIKLTISDFTYYNTSSKKRNEVLQELACQRNRLSHNLEANRLQREIDAAHAYLLMAREQVEQAEARVEIAKQRIAIAQMQEQHTRENLEFLKNRKFRSAIWYNLSQEARRLARRYQEMAIEIATLMEKAYEAETGRNLRKIKFEYGLKELDGLLGAEALLLDIEYFTLDHLRTKSKKAQMKRTISLADNFPLAFSRLLQTGRTFFETTLEHFDRNHPGFYLNKVKQVEVVFVGLTGTEGISGTLRNIGLSQFRNKSGSIVNQTYPADVMPLSAYNVRQDALVFQLDSKELRLFENNGVATMWQLDLPRSVNTFDLRQILDIHLVIYYDGFFDANLEQQILASLPAGGSASRGVSLRLYAPDELYFLRSQGSAELYLTPDLFPANQTNLRLKSYSLQVLGENVAGLRVRVDVANLGVAHTFQIDQSGYADGKTFTAPLNRSLFDTWTFTIRPEDNPGFDLSGLTDLAMFLEYEYDYRS